MHASALSEKITRGVEADSGSEGQRHRQSTDTNRDGYWFATRIPIIQRHTENENHRYA